MCTPTKDRHFDDSPDLEFSFTREDLFLARQQLFLEFAASPKTLAERMIEDSKEYERWLNAQEHNQTNSLY